MAPKMLCKEEEERQKRKESSIKHFSKRMCKMFLVRIVKTGWRKSYTAYYGYLNVICIVPATPNVDDTYMYVKPHRLLLSFYVFDLSGVNAF